MLTDLQPHQQCAAIVMRLGGAAREMARLMTPQEMAYGGIRNGVAVDPVTYLLGSLHARFAALEEESRLTCMTEMLAFNRMPSETINAMLARYETVRQRAAVEGQFVMSVEGCSLQVLRACGIQSHQLFILLQPFGGTLPQTDQHFQQLCTQLRRFGHISEGSHGNVATALHGPLRQARTGTYMANQDHQAYQTVARQTANQPEGNSSLLSFFGQSQPNQGPGTPWHALEPDTWQPAGQTDPFSYWQSEATGSNYGGLYPGGGQQADTGEYEWYQTQAYPTEEEEWEDITDTDTDTSSDDGMEALPDPGVSHLDDPSAAEHLYWIYRQAKRTWRRFTGKPVRKFRRAMKWRGFRKGKGKGKGRSKGKGKGHSFLWTQEEVLVYLKGRGKGHRANTSGKGHGRRKNPKDRQGNIMRCRICNSEDHFAARCPQGKGKGKSGSSSSGFQGPPSSFTGFARDPLTTTSGGQQADAGGTMPGAPQAPWADDDLMFETEPVQAQMFASFPEETSPRDPVWSDDPWRVTPSFPRPGIGYNPIRTPASSQENRWQTWQEWQVADQARSASRGAASARSGSPARQRVTTDDELSSSHTQTPPGTPTVRGRTAAQPTGLPGFTTPIEVRPLTYAGATDPTVPLERRTGVPNLTEQQVINVLQSQRLATSTRPAAVREAFHPHLLRHCLPLSTASASSARVRQGLTLTPPSIAQSSLDRVTESIRLVGRVREVRDRERPRRDVREVAEMATAMTPPMASQQAESDPMSQDEEWVRASAASQHTGTDGTHRTETNIQPTGEVVIVEQLLNGVPPSSGALPSTPTESQSAAPSVGPSDESEVIPIIYDGMDDACAICLNDFRQGEMVCRLVCRHMYHAECWERYVQAQTTRISCPICRGAGTLLSVWRYISLDVITQEGPDGQQVPNLLEADADCFMIGTPRTEPEGVASSSGAAGSGTQAPAASGGQQAKAGGPMQTSTFFCSTGPTYHIQTRLADGRPAIIIDPGSVGNLCGDAWAKEVAKAAARHGHKPSYEKRAKLLKVSGVGEGSQACAYDCQLPVALRQADKSEARVGQLTTPTVSNSDLPGLLGLTALRKNRAILDFNTMRLYFTGPGDYDLMTAMPPGTESFQGEIAPSGHMVLPCCEFEANTISTDHTLTLVARQPQQLNQDRPVRERSCRRIPPPPVEPPVLPVDMSTTRSEQPPHFPIL